jgi:hypothetical protein
MGDAEEACEMMFWMIQEMAAWLPVGAIERAEEAFYSWERGERAPIVCVDQRRRMNIK